MAAGIRFHLVEHVDPAIATGLHLRGIGVTTTIDAGLLGAEDIEHIEFALREGRVIFSQDDDFLRLHAAGIEHAGIAYCHPEARTIGQLIRGLVLIYECMTPDEMRGHVEFI
jgi:hypothetical protein